MVAGYGCYSTLQMAEVVVPREVFGNILRLLDVLPPAPPSAYPNGTPACRLTCDHLGNVGRRGRAGNSDTGV